MDACGVVVDDVVVVVVARGDCSGVWMNWSGS